MYFMYVSNYLYTQLVFKRKFHKQQNNQNYLGVLSFSSRIYSVVSLIPFDSLICCFEIDRNSDDFCLESKLIESSELSLSSLEKQI